MPLTSRPEAARFAPVLPPEIREEVERRLREFPRDLEIDLPAPRTARARLGITTTPLTNQLAAYFGVKDGGVLVSAVAERSPSATAGLKAGDVIIEIDGAPVRTPQTSLQPRAERLQERCWTFEWSAKRKKRRPLSELLLKRSRETPQFDVVASPLTFVVRANQPRGEASVE